MSRADILSRQKDLYFDADKVSRRLVAISKDGPKWAKPPEWVAEARDRLGQLEGAIPPVSSDQADGRLTRSELASWRAALTPEQVAQIPSAYLALKVLADQSGYSPDPLSHASSLFGALANYLKHKA